MSLCARNQSVDLGRQELLQEMYQDLLFHLISAKKPLEGIEHGR